jgi:hypothetical protein
MARVAGGGVVTAAEDATLAEMVSLIAERDRLRQEVEDLRAFERDYRARLLAFHEAQARDLKQGEI